MVHAGALRLLILRGSAGGGTTYTETATLSGVAGTGTITAALRAAPALTLGAGASAGTAGPLVLPGSITLSATALHPYLSWLVGQAVATLSGQAGLTADGTVAGGAQTYNETVTLAQAAAASPVGRLVVPSTQALSAAASLAATGRLAVPGQIALSAAATCATVARLVVTATTPLGTSAAVVALTTHQLAAQLGLAVAAALETTGAVAGTPEYDVLQVAGEVLRAASLTLEGLQPDTVRDEDLL